MAPKTPPVLTATNVCYTSSKTHWVAMMRSALRDAVDGKKCSARYSLFSRTTTRLNLLGHKPCSRKQETVTVRRGSGRSRKRQGLPQPHRGHQKGMVSHYAEEERKGGPRQRFSRTSSSY